MFQKNNVLDFLYEVIKGESMDIIPIVKYLSLDKGVVCQNKVFTSKKEKNLRVCSILLNRKYFGVVDRNFLKASLLHEIGHAMFRCRSKTDNEYYAHMWAIDKANKMGLSKVVLKLIVIILEWGDMDWNTFRNRRYILAYKKFKNLFKAV